ncbi:MAG: hydrogenase maturation protease [Acidobacteria bacterium]|nr:hydrogenase maturation protease [Acidobacteriota bacterium]MBI3423960.1 hydrogenase maturation protease [Acidobacteriota bacterium]
MTRPCILIACIGNIFLGDDGFGVEVAKRLAARTWPAEVRMEDFGIRGFDLAYALLEGYDTTIFVDATQRGGRPGTLYVIEPDLAELETAAQTAGPALLVDPHGMNPLKVLQMARALGAQFNQILLVGCEPETLGPEEGLLGLSAPVAAAVREAVPLIETLVNRLLNEQRESVAALTTAAALTTV